MHRSTIRAAWTAAFVAVLTVPVLLAWGRHSVSLWGAMSVEAGMLALCALLVTVIAPSRIRSLTAAFGVERIMGLHRWLGVGSVIAVLVHIVLAVSRNPTLLVPTSAPAPARAGWAATAALLLVGGAAARGRRRGARYEVWARVHVALAAAVLLLAGLHVYWLRGLVADPVMRWVLSLLVVALLGVLAHRWVWRPLFSRQGAYVVYGVRRESPTVSTLVLAPIHLRRGGLRFSPGQFVWLRLRRGVVGTEEHPFTIASSATVTGRLELTVRDSGDFSITLAALRTGSKVWLDGPHGSFTADGGDARSAEGLVLLAGGVGITPMMSMLRTLADRGDHRHHRMVLAERGDEPLFADELAALERRLDLVVTRTEGRRIDAALLAGILPPPGARERLDYFVCGSPSVLAGSLAALEQLGIPATTVHTEQFGWSGAVPVPAGPSAPAPAVPGSGPTPTTGRHGRRHARRA